MSVILRSNLPDSKFSATFFLLLWACYHRIVCATGTFVLCFFLRSIQSSCSTRCFTVVAISPRLAFRASCYRGSVRQQGAQGA
ncbi:uncharacterized protein BDV14DRAFT_101032 [Aspergillus stella-maris]|uniref:uncharacterized protein n=1 Tax=Aspergillus stella-maris TaxID=1810926 RepID=UPI003CCD7282